VGTPFGERTVSIVDPIYVLLTIVMFGLLALLVRGVDRL
jgi:hypothetical protein